MDLFSNRADQLQDQEAPLAARMRPATLEEFVGQAHVLGPGSALRALIEADELRSVILWGPAGTGKTSLAHIIARATRSHYEELSATSAGVKDVRALLAAARERLGALGRRSILFIDEIHRFNKAQQDALLPGVEDRTVVLVGATTENPFFTVNAPLMSRSLLFRLEPLGHDDLETIVERALADPERGLGGRGLTLEPDALAHLVDRADGDARHALNALEAAALVVTARQETTITLADIEDALQRPRVTYDRAGDQHYDVISAFIKSVRGSDVDAALHYLARMIEAGEDPRFIARRIIVLASEDVGMADPTALGVAVAAADAVQYIGMPEGRIPLAQAVVHLATAPKSNAAYLGIDRAITDVREGKAGRVPKHLRDAHYPGAKRLGHGKGYVYPHDDPIGVVPQEYLPESLRGAVYYEPTEHGNERDVSSRLAKLRRIVRGGG
jgi:putative ATPase